MEKSKKYLIISFIATLILTALLFIKDAPQFLQRFSLEIFLLDMACAICFISFLIIYICAKTNKNISGYKIFAIVDIVIAVIFGRLAAFDYFTSTGMWAGMLAVLILIFVLPVNLVLLVIDGILYLISKKKSE